MLVEGPKPVFINLNDGAEFMPMRSQIAKAQLPERKN